MRFLLYKDGNPNALQDVKPARDMTQFPIHNVSRKDAGSYSCYYRSKSDPPVWSYPSDPVELVVAELPAPGPSISVIPSGVIAPGVAVTIRCQCQCEARRLFLYKDGIEISELDAAGDRGEFTIPRARREDSGIYSCRSRSRSEPPNWSDLSDYMRIVVAELRYPKPSISLHPSAGVALGGAVTVQCRGWRQNMRFLLHKFGNPNVLQDVVLAGNVAEFPIHNVSRRDAGSYCCYYHSKSDPSIWSEPSDPVELVIAEGTDPDGLQEPHPPPTEPAGEAPPRHSDFTHANIARLALSAVVLLVLGLILAEGAVILEPPNVPSWWVQATKDPGMELVLHKAGHLNLQVRSVVPKGKVAEFPITSVSQEDGGSYTCNYRSITEYSSDPVEIIVGEPSYPKPNISLSPSGGVSLGGAVAIWCRRQSQGVRFVLNKEGRHFPPVDSDGFGAVFPISNVSREDGGSYSCSYHRRSEPFTVSYPSDPVELVVRDAGSIPTEGTDLTQPGAVPAPTHPGSTGPGESPVLTWPVIAGVSTVAAILLFILVAFVCFRKKRARKGAAPRPSSVSPLRVLKAPDQQDSIYTSIDEEKELQTLEPNPDADRLTYAELDNQVLQAKQGAKSPAPEPAQPSMYAMINVNRGPCDESPPQSWGTGPQGATDFKTRRVHPDHLESASTFDAPASCIVGYPSPVWDDEPLLQNGRMREPLLGLHAELAPALRRKDTQMRDVSRGEVPAIALWTLAIPDCYWSVVNPQEVGKSTAGRRGQAAAERVEAGAVLRELLLVAQRCHLQLQLHGRELGQQRLLPLAGPQRLLLQLLLQPADLSLQAAVVALEGFQAAVAAGALLPVGQHQAAAPLADAHRPGLAALPHVGVHVAPVQHLAAPRVAAAGRRVVAPLGVGAQLLQLHHLPAAPGVVLALDVQLEDKALERQDVVELLGGDALALHRAAALLHDPGQHAARAEHMAARGVTPRPVWDDEPLLQNGRMREAPSLGLHAELAPALRRKDTQMRDVSRGEVPGDRSVDIGDSRLLLVELWGVGGSAEGSVAALIMASALTILLLSCWLAGHNGVWGEPSYPKPSISLLSPSGEVSLGETVSIWCKRQRQGLRFVLNKEGRHFPPVDSDGFGAVFPIINVSREDGGIYNCSYHSQSEPFNMSYPSDPMELVVRDPSLTRPNISLSLTGVMAPGADVIIWCQGQRRDVRFFLHKAGDLNLQQQMDPTGAGAVFRIPSVGRQHGGSYSCSYRPQSEPFVSSQPSDTVQLVVAEPTLPKPSISPSREVSVGGSVSIQCLGLRPGVRFVLNKGGRHAAHVDTDKSQFVFPINNVQWEQGGNYSCSHHSRSEPFTEWSDPVELVVRAAPLGYPDFININIAHLVLSAVVLLILGLILAEAYYSRPRGAP
nr:immunoglobulin superfamily member 1-like [Chelonoidis abingdonii]